MTSKNIESHYSFGPNFIEIKGSKIHYIEEGSGDPILFIHGMPSWSYLWRNVIPHVSSTGRCIALDLIGFGKSDSPNIEFKVKDELEYLTSFIEKLNLKNISIIGHSWGAVLGLLYAKAHETNVKAIAYLEPMLGEWKSWSDFNPTYPPAQEMFKMLRSEKSWDLIVNQNIFMEQIFVNASIRELSAEEKEFYIKPFEVTSRRKSAWRAPQELPIEGSPSDVCQMVNSLYHWMKTTSIPQLFFYTNPAAFFTEEKRKEFVDSARTVSDHFLGNGRYNHLEDYPVEVGTTFANWLREHERKR